MKIVFIGSGNVATSMAHAFIANGDELLEIWSPNLDHASILAAQVGAVAAGNLGVISTSADLYVIAVKDDAIADVVASLPSVTGIVVHTSGSTDMAVLSSLKAYGIFYPLQTFSKSSKAVDFKNVPLCIEASNTAVLLQLEGIAASLSDSVYHTDSAKRKVLHLSAVFACNFVNHLYALGNQVLEQAGMPFEMLRPLILETALKVQEELPGAVQTGPAVRADEKTMEAHLALLKHTPELGDIYRALSDSIKKTYQ